MKIANALIAVAVLALSATQLSCTVNQYCIGCELDDAGGGTEDAPIDGNDGGFDDSMVDGGCLPSGTEICDGKDNDCDGLTDNGVLPDIGNACDNVTGACSGGVFECTNGVKKCSKLPTPEQCDGIDNNCNGVEDENDPGGGGTCGTAQGECVLGNLHCAYTAGCISTMGCNPLTQNCCVACQDSTGAPWVGSTQDRRLDMETCNGKDDNCNGLIDDGVGNLGTCGPTTDVGLCTFGTRVCQGGAPVCTNAVFPAFEICNGEDDNCNGQDDEIFDFETDPRNCGMCGTVCAAASRTCINSTVPATNGTNCTTSSMCAGGTCSINSQPVCAPNASNVGTCGYQCNPGFIDRDLAAGNGCEYRCFASGPEVCDGVDNDCDGTVDNGLTPPAICLSGGECGMTAPVAQCNGNQGWRCTYPGNTQFPETRCDGLNNDCDANVDENQPNLTQACDDGRTGVCRGTGTFACNTASELLRNGPAICDVTTPGQATADLNESCDDRDNDCDGKTDEGSELGNLIGQDWVTIGGGRQIMKYEASRQDSSSTQQGSKSGVNVATIVTSPGGATQSGATATFTTTAPHGLTPNTKVRVSGLGVSGYNGLWTVATVPTTTTFTATLATTGLAASGGGTVTKFIGACSKSGAVPWTNVTYPEALAVCESMGASLCPETRWHQACSVVPPRSFPVTIDGGTTATSGTRIEAEDFFANVAAGGPEVACTGAIDDDGDGRVNDGCPAFITGGGPETGAQCANSTDDDGDGRVNDGCPTQEEGAETGVQCDNNIDDDGDGRDNDGCPAVQEDGETGAQCNNNNDDDGDGRINDGCPFVSTGIGPETGTQCGNNNDDDNDGRDNDGCPTVGAAPESGAQCLNNTDDDGDGRDNDGCPAVQRDGETVAQCSNNTDDDNDGRINDGCAVVTSGIGPETGTQCNNNTDDDGDGRDNDGCPTVIQGAGPETACANTTDDDADGFVNDGCPEFIGGGEAGAQCDNNVDDDGDGIANDGCPSVGPQSWQEDYTPANANLTGPQQHSGISNMRALPNSNAVVGLGSALAQSPHLDYRVMLPAAGTNWRVWVRMYSPTGNDDAVHVSVSTSATAIAPTATLITSVNNQWVWMSTGDLNLAMGEQYIRLFMGDDGLKVDAIFIARSGTPQPPTALNGDGGTWSYATNADTYQSMTCNGADRNVANDDIMATGANASCYADHDGAASVAHVFDMSGNVKEWTLARLPGQNPIRGGASNDTAVGTSCSLNFILGTDSFFFPNVGFRCCK